MIFDAAVFKEQGVSVAVIVVKPHVLNNYGQRDSVRNSYRSYFPGCNIILMSQDLRGTPTYYGRKDITHFLSHISTRALPFKRYSFN